MWNICPCSLAMCTVMSLEYLIDIHCRLNCCTTDTNHTLKTRFKAACICITELTHQQQVRICHICHVFKSTTSSCEPLDEQLSVSFFPSRRLRKFGVIWSLVRPQIHARQSHAVLLFTSHGRTLLFFKKKKKKPTLTESGHLNLLS